MKFKVAVKVQGADYFISPEVLADSHELAIDGVLGGLAHIPHWMVDIGRCAAPITPENYPEIFDDKLNVVDAASWAGCMPVGELMVESVISVQVGGVA